MNLFHSLLINGVFMKIFKTALDFLTLSILTTLFILFCLRENEELIPNSKYIVAISEWDHKISKKEILESINTIAKKENISIYKSFATFEDKNKKGIYIFNEKSDNNLKYVVSSPKINKMSYEEFLIKDIRGKYFVTEKHFDKAYLVKSLSNKGLKVELFKVNRWILFLETVNNHFLLIPIVSIIVIYLLYYVHEKNKKFKEISIKTLNGYSFLSIIFEKLYIRIAYWLMLYVIQVLCALIAMYFMDLNNNYLLFIQRLLIVFISFTLIITFMNLLTYTMLCKLDIASMIKGNDHFKLIRLIATGSKCIILFLLTVLIIQNLSTFNELSKINDSKKYWSQLKNYYTIELAPIKMNEKEVKMKAHGFHQFIKDSESKNNAILIRSNNIYNPQIHNYNPYSGNILYVNQKFLELYGKNIFAIQTLQDKPQSIEVMLPKAQSNVFHKIKDEFIEWSYFQNEFKRKLNVEITRSKDNNNIFSYDNRTENSYKFLKSPAIVLLNSKDLADDFYYASLSQGAYLFKNYADIEESLNRLHLKDYVSGITSYTDSIEQNLRETNIKLIIVTFSGLLLIIVGIIAIIFDIQYYFEQNKKDLLIKRLYGFNVFKTNFNYISLNLLITWIIGATCYFYMKNMWVIYIFIVITMIQLLIQCLQIVSLNQSFTKKILEL
ncbi:DUF1430 domain-containing protein [Staphylococcus caprae]|uniref:DUF1430 domain-containing protein n=1 Tax=Staphylococcus caprae TaxID=29380 RepID=UPI001C83B671|nr:DUF1430 domain-containing protein [Staphylococcus caprae]